MQLCSYDTERGLAKIYSYPNAVHILKKNKIIRYAIDIPKITTCEIFIKNAKNESSMNRFPTI